MERKVVCYDEITATWYEKSSMERRSADNGNHGTITALKNVFCRNHGIKLPSAVRLAVVGWLEPSTAKRKICDVKS